MEVCVDKGQWSLAGPLLGLHVRLLGGQGGLVSGLMMGITRVTIWVTGLIYLLPKFP